MAILDDDGRITNPEVNQLGNKIGKEVGELFDRRTDWSMADKTVVAYHLQGFINTKIMQIIMGKLIKKQQETEHRSLRPETRE